MNVIPPDPQFLLASASALVVISYELVTDLLRTELFTARLPSPVMSFSVITVLLLLHRSQASEEMGFY